MEERRKYERAEANCTVEIALPRGLRRLRRGFLAELSEGGGLLTGDLGCSVGTELRIWLWFPDLSDMLCTGVVRSARDGNSFGVEWTNLAPQDYDRLAEFVRRPQRRNALWWQPDQTAEPPADASR